MANGQQKRLLVVDDDKAIRNLLARIAERAGFVVDKAEDGVEALELLKKRQYAIAIVDLMMPRLSGYELVEEISKLHPRPVVLVATAMASSDVATLDDSMVRRVIRKPFDIEAVANALVETARQIADQQAHSAEGAGIAARPDVVKIPVASPSPEPEAASAAAATEDNAAIEDEKPVNKMEDPPTEGR